jgi:hypothetical protein
MQVNIHQIEKVVAARLERAPGSTFVTLELTDRKGSTATLYLDDEPDDFLKMVTEALRDV